MMSKNKKNVCKVISYIPSAAVLHLLLVIFGVPITPIVSCIGVVLCGIQGSALILYAGQVIRLDRTHAQR